MPILALGLNHTTAPVAVRERLAFPPESLPAALRELTGESRVEEAAILSTCNRTDVVCGVNEDSPQGVLEWLCRFHRLDRADIEPHCYTHREASAVRHLMRVASGLDSMVVGEPQILGQVKQAYAAARDSGTARLVLGKLFEHTFSAAKRVRTETRIGSSPVSVAYAAVALARQIFGDLSTHRALLVGAGDTVELTARHLAKQGLNRMVIANRSVANAQRLAAEFGAHAISLAELDAHLADADIVVASTASPGLLVTREQVRAALRRRKRRPVFIADLAVPRDVDAAVADLEDAYLYSVDDLDGVIEGNRAARLDEARAADVIIDSHVATFMDWMGTREVASTICELRSQARDARDEVLAKARRMLAGGREPEEVLEFLANTLTNKLLHSPTAGLRRAGAESRHELADAARVLFEIDPAAPAGGGRDDLE